MTYIPEANMAEALLWGKKTANAPAGFWGVPTGIDWCEKNYEVHPQIAEFWNTTSNIAFIIAGWLCYQQAVKDNLPFKFKWISITIILTGLASGVFHATLKKLTQQIDEIWENFILVGLYHSEKVTMTIVILHSILIAFMILFVTAFLAAEIHLISIVVAIAGKMVLRIDKTGAPPRVAKLMKHYVMVSSGIAIGGAVGWLIDRLACKAISTVLPLNPQLHAWWHFFCAVTLYQMYQVAVAVYHVKKQRMVKFERNGLIGTVRLKIEE